MAKNISLMGASYSDVPAVVLPQTGGGTARFDDASITTATAADVAQGKVFIAADGTITTGTASGGGSIVVVDTPDGHGGTIREITATNVTTLVEKTIAENGTYDPSDDDADGYSIVTVNVGGSTPVERSDVNFYDYDGTLLYSYTASEAAALEEMPSNPSHTGLTAQGWNYTLAEMQSEVTNNRICDIGQMYITDDGKTRLYCHFVDGRLSPMLGLCVDGTVVIDWGDSSATDTVTGTSTSTNIYTQHTYASSGDYVITLTVTSGTVNISGATSSSYYESRLLRREETTGVNHNRVYLDALRKVELGSGVTVGSTAFASCCAFETITMPNTITTISQFTFYGCYHLAHVVIPNSVTRIGERAFASCCSLFSFALPLSVSIGSLGTNILNACYGLRYITFPCGVQNSSIPNYAFTNCVNVVKLVIPQGILSIGTYAFATCYALTNLTIPSSVQSIGTYAFNSCGGIGEIHMKRTTPPTIQSNTFYSMASDCVIYVPKSEDHTVLNSYKNANNWSTYASQIQEEP